MENQRNSIIVLTDILPGYLNPNKGDLIVLRRGITEVSNPSVPWPTPLDVAFAQGKNGLIGIDDDLYRVPVIGVKNTSECKERMLDLYRENSDKPKIFFTLISGIPYIHELHEDFSFSSNHFYTAKYAITKDKLGATERKRLDNLINSIVIL